MSLRHVKEIHKADKVKTVRSKAYGGRSRDEVQKCHFALSSYEYHHRIYERVRENLLRKIKGSGGAVVNRAAG